MKYLDEFKNKELCLKLLDKIKSVYRDSATIMEVCGTHTTAIFRYGIRERLPENVKILSGPGCPVCVTPQEDIDLSIELSRLNDTITVTYGDMLRVPGTCSSLEKQRAAGRDIRIVYSALDAVDLAEKNQSKKIIFLGVGFETTAPATAVAVIQAKQKKLKNFFVHCCHKLIPNTMKALLESGETKIDGFICPGHVSTIIGSKAYDFIAERFNIPCVVAGFEPLDILSSIEMLLSMIKRKAAFIENQYIRSVKPQGNPRAMEILFKVFEECYSKWRGIGLIPASGLTLRDEYRDFDAKKNFKIVELLSHEPIGCICGEILRGVKTPFDCPLFASACTIESPVGPCMVSSEGTCGTYFRFGR